MPPRLYHGARELFLNSILNFGIVSPNLAESEGNWSQLISSPNLTYLAEGFGIIYALNLIAVGSDGRAILVEIDTRLLDTMSFVADEDFLRFKHQELVAVGAPPEEQDLWHQLARFPEESEELWRDLAHFPDAAEELWPSSLAENGTVAYRDYVPPSAISRYALIDQPNCPMLCDLASLPQLSPPGHRVWGNFFRSLTRFIFDCTPIENIPVTLSLGGVENESTRAICDSSRLLTMQDIRAKLENERANSITIMTV